MAGDWLKIRHDLREDPAVIAIAEITGLEEDHVVGKLHRIWSWADRQTIDGNAPSVTETYVDRYVNVTGFAQAMSAAGWLEITSEGIVFPNFDEHISETAKKRALTARRAKKHRAKSNAACVTVGVTKSAPKEEKRREESKVQTTSVSPEPDDTGSVLTFPAVGKGPSVWHLTKAKLTEYAGSYPGVDVPAECRKILQWCRDNPTKRKTARGYPAFINRWLSKAQNERGTNGKSRNDVRPSGRIHKTKWNKDGSIEPPEPDGDAGASHPR